MTTLELERLARNVIPPTGTTGWRIADTGVNGQWAVVPILYGRLDGRLVFEGGLRDCRRMHQLLSGDASTSRRAQVRQAEDPEQQGGSAANPALTELPEELGPPAAPRLCAGCDQPLPEGADPQRLTHGGACRVAAFRRRADADSAGGGVTAPQVIHGGQP